MKRVLFDAAGLEDIVTRNTSDFWDFFSSQHAPRGFVGDAIRVSGKCRCKTSHCDGKPFPKSLASLYWHGQLGVIGFGNCST